MDRTLAKGVFLGVLSVIAVVLVLAIYQVPQPWRGVLVGWLLLLGTVGAFILSLVGHYLRYKTAQLSARQPQRPPAPPRRARRAASSSVSALKVVMSNSAGNGRHTIR
jgi:hypothetical protein